MARALMSYVALAGGLASLAWMADRLEATPAARLDPWPMEAAPLVVVDAGHGGHDGGAVAGGTIEKNLALDLALRLLDQLKAHGLRVKMTRDTDVFIPLEDRSAQADPSEADAFVSLHLNTSPAPEVSGIETYCRDHKPLSVSRAQSGQEPPGTAPQEEKYGRLLAESVQRHACLATQAANRGIKQRNYAVVAQSRVPAALIECGFLTHPAEAARLKTADYQTRLTAGIAAGIAQFVKAQRVRLGPGRPLISTVPLTRDEVESPTP